MLDINLIKTTLLYNDLTKEDFIEHIKYSIDVSREDYIRYVLLTTLTEIELRILLIYAEVGSYSKAAEVFKCSSTKIFYMIRDIRDKIYKKLNKIQL